MAVSARDDTHMTSMKIVQFSRPPTSLVHQRPKFFHPLDLGRSISNEPPSCSNDNQSIKRKRNPRMTIMLPDPSFRSAFVFSINSLILPGFPLTSLHLTEASLSAFLWLYTVVCALAQKILLNVVYNYSHFSTHFAISLFYLHNLKM